ncbi:hypothetical protein HAX54_031677, partial [Datura stramonium]|nr:hypothetical protein [Datura stramonium]
RSEGWMVYRRRGLLVEVVRGKWGGAGTVVAVVRVTGGGEEKRSFAGGCYGNPVRE